MTTSAKSNSSIKDKNLSDTIYKVIQPKFSSVEPKNQGRKSKHSLTYQEAEKEPKALRHCTFAWDPYQAYSLLLHYQGKLPIY